MGSEGKNEVILNNLVQMQNMLKTIPNNIIPSPSNDSVKKAICM